MSDVVLLVPNDWVSEKVLIAVTGLKPGTILHRRKFGGGRGEAVAKAVGVKGSYLPDVGT